MHQIFEGVYQANNRFYTKSFAPGTRVYGERILEYDNEQYREWDIFKSKLAGAIKKGLKSLPIKPGSLVLYLGASTGTTPSHVSDIVGQDGGVFAVEFAQRSMRDLVKICEQRKNMLPIFADANQPQLYSEYINEKVDVLYQDVAQPNQAEILVKNANAYLKSGGEAMLCIKSQSIDVTQTPEESYRQTLEILEKANFETLQTLILDPYDKDHMFWHGRR
ncbi:MAG: fibrillarin-like rRNA/tRNA 2'-O-methyltransferase [Candidatus Micrarchaeia archaeon]